MSLTAELAGLLWLMSQTAFTANRDRGEVHVIRIAVLNLALETPFFELSWEGRLEELSLSIGKDLKAVINLQYTQYALLISVRIWTSLHISASAPFRRSRFSPSFSSPNNSPLDRTGQVDKVQGVRKSRCLFFAVNFL
jgi:hypothetical protein